MVSIDVRGSRNQDVEANLPAIIRPLQRPNANGFAQYLSSRIAGSIDMDQFKTMQNREDVMVRRIKEDLREIQGGFPKPTVDHDRYLGPVH